MSSLAWQWSFVLAFALLGIALLWWARQLPKRSPDAALIAQLKAAGTNLRAPHEVDFFFRGSRDGLAEIKTQLLAEGFRVETADSDDAMLATRRMILQRGALEALRERFNDLARKRDVAYDGWAADVVP